MKNLIQLREQAGLRQIDVAKEIGLSRQAYCSYENDKREPDLATLTKLANFFKVSVDYLLGLDTTPLQWTEADKALGVGNHPVKLTEKEWRILEAFNELERVKGEAFSEKMLEMIEAIPALPEKK